MTPIARSERSDFDSRPVGATLDLLAKSGSKFSVGSGPWQPDVTRHNFAMQPRASLADGFLTNFAVTKQALSPT